MKNYVKEHKGRKVPEGAVYYGNSNQCFYNANRSEFHSSLYSKWKPISCTVTARLAIELPEAPQEWNGEGLPPVGTVCEFKSMGHHDGFEWCIFQGFMSDKSYIIEYHHHTSPSMTTCRPFDPKLTTFRPLKTQQEKDREAFVKGLVKVLNSVPNGASLSDLHTMAEKAYDAGYAAPKATDNE